MNDLLRESLRMLGEGIEFLRQGHPLPAYLTPPVLNGLRELAGGISPHGVSRIQFQHPGGGFVIDSVFREALRRTPAQATEREVTVVGRLHMGDFSPATLRCRIDTYAGSILADFGSDLRDVILDAMDQLVMASGRAELQPDGVTVRVMHLETVKRLTGAPITPLDRLAQEQGVRPIGNVDELRGDPIDDLEEFLEVITAARRGEE